MSGYHWLVVEESYHSSGSGNPNQKDDWVQLPGIVTGASLLQIQEFSALVALIVENLIPTVLKCRTLATYNPRAVVDGVHLVHGRFQADLMALLVYLLETPAS